MPTLRLLPPNARRRGVAAVEFAIVLPMLLVMLISMIAWGGWLWMSHGVQSLAAESARAALAGLDPQEQADLAHAYVAAEAEATLGLPANRAIVEVVSDSTAIRVQVRYDVSDHPLLQLAHLPPAPPRVIERTAVVRTGGY